jgi:hypothetical protein
VKNGANAIAILRTHLPDRLRSGRIHRRAGHVRIDHKRTEIIAVDALEQFSKNRSAALTHGILTIRDHFQQDI